jgi:amidase
MAATVGGVVLGMQLLEPGFTVPDDAPRVIGRVRVPDIDPVIERALDDALARTEVEVVEIELPGFDHAIAAARTIMFGEAWHSFGDLFRRRPERIGRLTTARIELARAVTNDQLSDAREFRARWRAATSDVFTRVEVLALPTLHRFPARVDDADEQPNPLGSAAALAGVPALSLPVPSTGPVPASLQLIGPSGAEDRLLALGLLVESATP